MPAETVLLLYIRAVLDGLAFRPSSTLPAYCIRIAGGGGCSRCCEPHKFPASSVAREQLAGGVTGQSAADARAVARPPSADGSMEGAPSPTGGCGRTTTLTQTGPASRGGGGGGGGGTGVQQGMRRGYSDDDGGGEGSGPPSPHQDIIAFSTTQ